MLPKQSILHYSTLCPALLDGDHPQDKTTCTLFTLAAACWPGPEAPLWRGLLSPYQARGPDPLLTSLLACLNVKSIYYLRLHSWVMCD